MINSGSNDSRTPGYTPPILAWVRKSNEELIRDLPKSTVIKQAFVIMIKLISFNQILQPLTKSFAGGGEPLSVPQQAGLFQTMHQFLQKVTSLVGAQVQKFNAEVYRIIQQSISKSINLQLFEVTDKHILLVGKCLNPIYIEKMCYMLFDTYQYLEQLCRELRAETKVEALKVGVGLVFGDICLKHCAGFSKQVLTVLSGSCQECACVSVKIAKVLKSSAQVSRVVVNADFVHIVTQYNLNITKESIQHNLGESDLKSSKTF